MGSSVLRPQPGDLKGPRRSCLGFLVWNGDGNSAHLLGLP